MDKSETGQTLTPELVTSDPKTCATLDVTQAKNQLPEQRLPPFLSPAPDVSWVKSSTEWVQISEHVPPKGEESSPQ